MAAGKHHQEPEEERAPEAGRRGSFLLAATSGILTVLAFPRFGYSGLIWVAMVPLFFAATGAGARRGFALGLLAGLTLVGGGFNWVYYSMQAFTGLGPWAAFLFWPWLLFESLPWGLLGLALGSLRRGSEPLPGRIFAVIPFWVGLEHYYPRLFPWHVGGALHDWGRLAQGADLLGTSGLTFLVLLFNAALYRLLLAGWRRGPLPWWSLGLSALLLAALVPYGSYRLRQVDDAMAAAAANGSALEVGVIQPVAPPEEKRAGNSFFFDKMETLTRSLEGRAHRENWRLDLVLWPEGSDTNGYVGFDRQGRPVRPGNLLKPNEFSTLETPVVAGTWMADAPDPRPGDPAAMRQWNSAEFVLPKRWPPEGFYHKRHRLLFGEYVPGLEWIPDWLREKIGFVGTIEAGKESPVFTLPSPAGSAGVPFRILICYEAVLPSYVLECSAGVRFLANVTEDIWYGDTSHVGQHASVLELRAIENRISIVRSANIGPSGVIDPAGRWDRSRDPPSTPFEKCERRYRLFPVRLVSFYVHFGHFFPLGCLIVGLMILVGTPLRRWRHRDSIGQGA